MSENSKTCWLYFPKTQQDWNVWVFFYGFFSVSHHKGRENQKILKFENLQVVSIQYEMPEKKLKQLSLK